MSETRRTARNAGWVVIQRGLHVVTAAIFGVFVPRLMGPQAFGQYVLLTSVAMWFGMLTGVGAVSLMPRVVPQFMARNDHSGLRKLVSSLVLLRASTGLLVGMTYFAIITMLAGEIDRVVVVLIASAVFCRTISNVCFSLFLGLNRAARWGLGELVRHVLTLVGVAIGYPIAGLRGACVGVLAANIVVLVAGFVVARPYLRWSAVDLRREYLAPFLKIGTSFAAGNLLLAFGQRTGETIVRMASRDYAQVGFFGAAYAGYFNGASVLWQSALAFGPLLVGFQHRGDAAGVSLWLERLLKWMTVVAALVSLATVLVAGDLVPRLLGQAYAPVTASLPPLALALFAIAACSVGRLGALAADRPWLSAGAAAAEVVVYWATGLLLIPRYGAEGMAWAVLCGTATYGAVITWRMRDAVRYSPRAAIEAGALVVPWLLLSFVRGGALFNAALLVLATAGYLTLLWWRGIIMMGELRSLGEIVRGVGESTASSEALSVPTG